MPEILREYKMKFERVPAGEFAVREAVQKRRLGMRSKLGGVPDWDQGEENPFCPSCSDAMSFVAQIDSIEHDEQHNPHRVNCMSDDQQFLFGDVGIIYIFFCFDCSETQSVFQGG